ncbi:NUDIX domain-containing protein [Halosimplex pelagicum]|uniref:NUDIX domain-containing protein n=1 Tax=Halosimplex pelagicum TaxID=869886 RepID=A0A7D5TE66_9EURY|nr:NUDIX domain-containing protein [Halosimplex pelagicum]QLH83615.1 NUDIX domain-containing protein [Halosimplex pelagicum]
MVNLRDPESLREEPGVDFREQEQVVDSEAFEQATEGAENQSGLVVVAVTDEQGRLLLVDSEWVDGWTLPNGPVGADEDWAVAADRWSEDELNFPVQIEQPELVIRTETRTEDGDESVVGYTVAFAASLIPAMGGPGGMGPGGPPPGVGPDDEDASEGEGPPAGGGGPPGGAGPGGPGAGPIASNPNLDWFDGVPDEVAPGHHALVRYFLG